MERYIVSTYSPESCDWCDDTVARDIIKSITFDDEELHRFIGSLRRYHQLAVAYEGKDVVGVQVFDYDPHEMCIVLGSVMLSPLLNHKESSLVTRRLTQTAEESY
jgi:hypothetical protein